MTDFVVRSYRPDDLAACRELWVQLTEWHRAIYESPEIGGPNPGEQFDELLDHAAEKQVWVAEAEGKVVGMVG